MTLTSRISILASILTVLTTACDDGPFEDSETLVEEPATDLAEEPIELEIEPALVVPAGVDECTATCMLRAQSERATCRTAGGEPGACDEDAMGSFTACRLDACGGEGDLDPLAGLDLATPSSDPPVEWGFCQNRCVDIAELAKFDCVAKKEGTVMTCDTKRDEAYETCVSDNCCSFWSNLFGTCNTAFPSY